MMINHWGVKRILISVLLMCLALVAPAAIMAEDGTTYYVAPGGNDTWPGTITKPWASIDHAAAMLQAGDTVLIRAGEYNEWVETRQTGVDGALISFRAYPGETPVLDGTGVIGNDGFNIAGGHSYIHIEGLTIRDFAGYGLALWGNNQYVEITDVDISDNGTGIQLTEFGIPGGVVENLVIADSDVHDNRLAGVNCAPGPCRHVQITGTTAYDNGESGVSIADGFAVETGEDVALERCTANGNTGDGFDIKAGRTDLSRSLAWGNGNDGVKLWGNGVSLTNNISRDNSQAGIVLISSGAYTMTHNTVAHNAVESEDYALCVACDAPAATDVRMYNNIFAFNGGPTYFGYLVTLSADHNMYYSSIDLEIRAEFSVRRDFSRQDINYGLWCIETGNGCHSGSVDPMFVNSEGRNYRLQSGLLSSPAIDSGSNTWGADVDFDGVSRPQGDIVDIGAFEYMQVQHTVLLPLIAR